MKIKRYTLLLSLCFLLGFQSKSKADSLPVFNHIVICVLENHSYNQIIGSGADSFINNLADSGALFTKFYAETHPSQPNYLILFSGNTQGVKDGLKPKNVPFITPNLAAALITAKKTFKGFAEGLPWAGYSGDSNMLYARRHCPWINWQGFMLPNVIDSMLSRPFTDFPSNFSKLPTVSFVIPNTGDDMHDGTGNSPITKADQWLLKNLGSYISWTKANKSLFILVFDEDDDKDKNHIACIFYGAQVIKGKYADSLNHYNLLATLQKMYKLKPFGDSSKATNIYIKSCWDTGQKIIDTTKKDTSKITTILKTTPPGTTAWRLYPNPAKDILSLQGINPAIGKFSCRILDLNAHILMSIQNTINIPIGHLKNGTYLLEIQQQENLQTLKFTIEK